MLAQNKGDWQASQSRNGFRELLFLLEVGDRDRNSHSGQERGNRCALSREADNHG